ncbi:Mu transposase domain-containing protein [Leptospirillum ferriphilum]|uniref:Mu transposase domain-containing protein n=1 Tax=Leptospirillum ferriphilum TaxID=178606 RepID=UPI003EE4FC9A
MSVTDNLTPAVTKAGKGDADLNPDYASFCAHYNTVAMPARPRKPKDKNQIESELGLFFRWLRPSLVGKAFRSLPELREYTRKAAERYNSRVQRRTGQSRVQRLEEEKPHLLSLPPTPYEICEWRTARPHPDCHIQVRKNFYSVPYALRGKQVEVRIASATVEIFFRGERVATHRLRASNEQGRYATNPGHYPEAQKALLETVPGALRRKAAEAGPLTEQVVKDLFALGNHPLRYLRRVQGILALLREVTAQELEEAIATFRRLGEALPKPSMLLDAVRQSRALREEAAPIARRDNRFLRGTMPASSRHGSLPEGALETHEPITRTQGDCSWP